MLQLIILQITFGNKNLVKNCIVCIHQVYEGISVNISANLVGTLRFLEISCYTLRKLLITTIRSIYYHLICGNSSLRSQLRELNLPKFVLEILMINFPFLIQALMQAAGVSLKLAKYSESQTSDRLYGQVHIYHIFLG